jgi:hypothetical protein
MKKSLTWDSLLKGRDKVLESTSNLLLDFNFKVEYINESITMFWTGSGCHIIVHILDHNHVRLTFSTPQNNMINNNLPIDKLEQILQMGLHDDNDI